MTKKRYPEKEKEWREKNRKHINKYARELRKRKKEHFKVYNKEWREKNKEHHVEVSQNWRKANPDKVRAYQARRYQNHREELKKRSNDWRKANSEKVHLAKIKRKFGITEEQYNFLRISQNDKCAICNNGGSYQRLGVDHNHKTGQIRGLLCAQCNAGIGNLKDSIELLENSIKYLKKYDNTNKTAN
jgi:hypothetical protein